MSLVPPQLPFGPFELLQPLGGGMGIVFRARRSGAPAEVALKLLRQERLLDGEARGRFARERRALQALAHPGICPLLEAGEIDGMPYLCMPLLRGRSLAEHLCEARRTRRLELPGAGPGVASWQHVVATMAKVADALHAAHLAGFCHRDVKPANLWIGEDGEPVLLDFGLAQDGTDRYRHLTRTGQLVGTPAYLAPEQLDARRGRVTARADVYGLCAVLYEALALQPPFAGDSRAELFSAILSGMSPALQRLRPELPEALLVVIAAGMAARPGDRYASAAALAADLRAVVAGGPIAMRPLRWPVRLLRAAGRRSVVLTLAVVALLTVGLALDAFERTAAMLRAFAAQRAERDDWAVLGRFELARTSYHQLPPPWPQHRAAFAGWLRDHGRPLQASPATAEATAPGLHAFLAAAVADVERRWQWAGQLAAEDGGRWAAAWATAAAAVAADPRTAGLALHELPGLVPLGADPGSGLQEFYDRASGDAELQVPARAADGRLQLAERHGIVFVLLPDSRFRLVGSSWSVRLQPFLLAKHELTRAQHSRLRAMGALQGAAGNGRLPADFLVAAEVRRLLSGWGLDLPTEAQWEYAARAGDGELAPLRAGNFVTATDGYAEAAPVGSFPPDAFGLQDMLGNVNELCADAAEIGAGRGRDGDGLRQGASGAEQIVVRGGSFGAPRWDLTGRQVLPADQRTLYTGVRPARRIP